MLPTTQFAYWKGLGTCGPLLCMSHTLQSALESGKEARIVQIDFNAAFERVIYQGIICKFWSMLSMSTRFLSNRSPRYGGRLSE